VRSVAREFLDDPGFLSLSSDKVSVEEIKYRYYLVNPMDKDRVLEELLELEEPESALIFANTKREVRYLDRFLSNKGYDVDQMSGDLSQPKREKALDRLREGELRLLVATDVAARGIDVSDLSHVFIYDVPQDHEYIIHRSGRTARAGKDGAAIAFCAPDEMGELRDIQKVMKLSIPVASGRPWEAVDAPAGAKKGGGGRGGPRGGGGGKPGGASGGRRRRSGGGRGRGRGAQAA